MSAEVTIICDDCHSVIGAGPSSLQARNDLRPDGAMVVRNGRDVCIFCERDREDDA